MNDKLNGFVKENYTEYKSDFFSAFVIHSSEMTKRNGFCGFFTPYVWMFIQSYEKMRNYLYNKATIETLIQFEYSAFEEATVPVCTFVFCNRHISKKKGCYLRLVDFRGGMEVQRQKTLETLNNHNCEFYYEQSTDNFSKIPGSPVAYWVSEKTYRIFDEGDLLGNIADSKQGIATADNNTFLRLWCEIDWNKMALSCKSHEEAQNNGMKWFPYNKGGQFRKWYGNNDYLIDWEYDGRSLKKFKKSVIRNLSYFFKPSGTWSDITSGTNAFRYKPIGSLFDVTGMSFFSKDKLNYLIGLCNTKVVTEILKIVAPTMHCQCGDVANIPVILTDKERKQNIENKVKSCINISCNDWDSFETSWDFRYHPLIRKVVTIAEAFDHWQAECDERFNQLKANEEELNRIFIEIYGLQDELTPEVEDKDVTVRKADLGRDIRSFISYAVGCMLGRYSLYNEGLLYAGGLGGDFGSLVEKIQDYLHEQGKSRFQENEFYPDADNIIPICDDEYFEDDIVGLFVEFVKTVYGADTLDENLKFIADALGGKGQPKDVIRNYFLSGFYSDHCKIYQKRPIYWLFDSGKKNGFKALIYMHRYQPDTIARIRTDYVHEQQARYRTAIADLEQQIANAASTGERVKLNKKLTALQAQDAEIRTYEEKIHHLADQMISIDLDDGVKKNYAIFQDVLAKIK